MTTEHTPKSHEYGHTPGYDAVSLVLDMADQNVSELEQLVRADGDDGDADRVASIRADLESVRCLVALAPEMLETLQDLTDHAEGFMNLAMYRGCDLRAEAPREVRNRIATARTLLRRARGEA